MILVSYIKTNQANIADIPWWFYHDDHSWPSTNHHQSSVHFIIIQPLLNHQLTISQSPVHHHLNIIQVSQLTIILSMTCKSFQLCLLSSWQNDINTSNTMNGDNDIIIQCSVATDYLKSYTGYQILFAQLWAISISLALRIQQKPRSQQVIKIMEKKWTSIL